MKNGTYGCQIFILVAAAVPFWLPLVLWLGYALMGWMGGRDSAAGYEKRWEIEFSSEWKEVCHADSGPSFHGDGMRYGIYENVSEGSIAELGCSFVRGKNDAVAEEFQDVTEALETEDKNQPDFTKDFAWARLAKEDGSFLILLFFPEDNRMFLAEVMI